MMDFSFNFGFCFDPNNKTLVAVRRLLPNRWDFVVFLLMIGLITITAIGFEQTIVSISTPRTQPILLNPIYLPEYALYTTLRMFIAILAAFVFTLVYVRCGAFATKSKQAEKVLVLMLDILQSVPVSGYIPLTITFFISISLIQVVAAECAAIFAIFTSQAWGT